MILVERPVHLPVGADLHADLAVPSQPIGIVVFAHGSGSGRRSPRNRMVAALLQERGMVTLLLDLLTSAEEAVDQATRQLRFDVELLAGRLAAAASWCDHQRGLTDLPIGYFGASTGAGAALLAAARHPEHIRAVVSRGGRPDLAGHELRRVEAPTLLIVGGADELVLDRNRSALGLLRGEAALEVVPGATHLFEEPGALETVAELAAGWFTTHLGAAVNGPPPSAPDARTLAR